MSTEGQLRPEDTTGRPGIAEPDKPDGPVVAAILAAGVGSLALGVLTTLAEASTKFKDWLAFDDGVGPLAGKTTLAVVAWLLSWAILHVVFRKRTTDLRQALIGGLVLVALGLLGTFPTFFQMFTTE
jgi:hypothetical protein